MKYNKLILFMLLGIIIVSAGSFSSVIADSDEDTTESDHTDDQKTDEEDHTDNGDSKEDSDGDGYSDDEESAYERQVQVEVQEKQIQIQSELKNGENKDKIKFEFEASDKPEFKLKYETENNDSESEMKFKVKFFEIIEYSEDATPGFNNETVLSSYGFDEENQFADITYDKTGSDPNVVHVFTAVTNDGVFKLIVKLSGSLQNDVVSGATLTPNSLKIDVEINDFPYTGNDSSLALVSRLKTEYDLDKEDQTAEEIDGFSANEAGVGIGTSGFFTWAETADADGSTIDVVTSNIVALDDGEEEEDDLEEGETVEKMYFSFIAKGAKKIYWDPKVGVLSVGTQELINNLAGTSGLPGFSWLGAFFMFSLVSLIRRKRKIN